MTAIGLISIQGKKSQQIARRGSERALLEISALKCVVQVDRLSIIDMMPYATASQYKRNELGSKSEPENG
jgi:hypothetical protein